MGEPGREPRRFRVGRAKLTLLGLAVLGLPVAGAALGYTVGQSHGRLASPVTTDRHQANPTPQASNTRAAPEPIEATPAQPDAPATDTVAVAAPEEAPNAAEKTAAGAPASDASLRVLPKNGGDPVELQPFDTTGAPRAGAFSELASLMACSDGTEQAPSPALVQMLVRAQDAFNRPVMVLGGRCSAHGNDEGSQQHHRTGRAIDFRLRGVSTKRLTDWLVEQGAGGVGRYGKRGLVHLDLRSGTPHQWEEEAQASTQAKATPRPRRAPPESDEGAEASEEEAEPTQELARSAAPSPASPEPEEGPAQ